MNASILAQPRAPIRTIYVISTWISRSCSPPPADRIVYTEHWLRRDGYAPRQFWRPESEPTIEGAIPV
jgi:hypothetical protein